MLTFTKDIYVWILRLWYNYKVEQRQQIISKLRRQVMRALNIKVGDILRQTKPVHNPYKDSLDEVLDSNINDIVASIIDMNLCPLRRITSVTSPKMLFDVPFLSRLFSKASSGGDKNSSLSAKRSLSPTLSPSIVPREPSNPLLKPTSNYGKLWKGKPRAALTSRSLGELDYITDQSGPQGAFVVSKNNVNGTESFWRNRMQKGSSIIKEQKGDVRSHIS